MQDNLAQTLKDVHHCLELAKACNMQTEVIAFAMTFLKENAELTPSEAMQLALLEWDIK
jgi:hypothetical protein